MAMLTNSSSTNLSLFNQTFINFSFDKETSSQKKIFGTRRPPIDYRDYVEDFVQALESQVLASKTSLSALKALLKSTNSQNKQVSDALFKTEGYIFRLFSDESWGEWWENKTPIGKVTHAFNQYLLSLVGISSTLDTPVILDQSTVLQANREAKNLLNHLKKDKLDILGIRVKSLVSDNPSFFSPLKEASRLLFEVHFSSSSRNSEDFKKRVRIFSEKSVNNPMDVLEAIMKMEHIEVIPTELLEKMKGIFKIASGLKSPLWTPDSEFDKDIKLIDYLIDNKNRFKEVCNKYIDKLALKYQIENLDRSIEITSLYVNTLEKLEMISQNLLRSPNILEEFFKEKRIFSKNEKKILNELISTKEKALIENKELKEKITKIDEILIGISLIEKNDKKMADECLEIQNSINSIKAHLENQVDKNKEVISNCESQKVNHDMKDDMFSRIPTEISEGDLRKFVAELYKNSKNVYKKYTNKLADLEQERRNLKS